MFIIEFHHSYLCDVFTYIGEEAGVEGEGCDADTAEIRDIP